VPAADAATRKPFAYALLRVVPRAERGERLNVGIVLYSRQHDFLDMRTHVDGQRLTALDPGIDPEPVRARLDALRSVVCGEPEGGALAQLPASERFGWIVAPASTILQASEVHTGLTDDPKATLDRLFASLVS
jgi:hypothetical protein